MSDFQNIDMSRRGRIPKRDYLAQQLSQMIQNGVLTAGARLPSKKKLAGQLGISVITVQEAYARLIEEGLLRSAPRSGYFVERLDRELSADAQAPETEGIVTVRDEDCFYDPAANSNHNRQKKIAAINDVSGFGRCSLTVSLPVISAMKVQCCPLPTSIFSNHTGFPSFFYQDFTKNMKPYIKEWKKLGLRFDGIMTGFLGSVEQIEIVRQFFHEFNTDKTVNVVDPVMGDYGRLYPTYKQDMVDGIRDLVRDADIVVPNLTEACFLTGTPFSNDRWSIRELTAMAEKISMLGPQKVVITGIPQQSFISNLCYEPGKPVHIIRTHRIGTSRSGTGDIFTSIIVADAVNGVEFDQSVRKASQFIKRCIKRSIDMDLPLTDGVCFEEVLHTLR